MIYFLLNILISNNTTRTSAAAYDQGPKLHGNWRLRLCPTLTLDALQWNRQRRNTRWGDEIFTQRLYQYITFKNVVTQTQSQSLRIANLLCGHSTVLEWSSLYVWSAPIIQLYASKCPSNSVECLTLHDQHRVYKPRQSDVSWSIFRLRSYRASGFPFGTVPHRA